MSWLDVDLVLQKESRFMDRVRGLLKNLVVFIALAGVVSWTMKDPMTEYRNTVQHIQNITVLVKNGKGGRGTGVAFHRGDGLYVMTNFHVIVRQIDIDTKGQIYFPDIKVVKFLTKNGATRHKRDCDAEVVAISKKYDLAILQVKDRDFIKESVKFYPETREIPFVGMPILHVGNYFGERAVGSLTSGIIAFQGRVMNDGSIFDQANLTVVPGSSGGGVFDYQGNCIGITTRYLEETMGLFDPIREIRAWAKSSNSLWVVDPNVPVPPREELIRKRDEEGWDHLLGELNQLFAKTPHQQFLQEAPKEPQKKEK